MKRSREKRDVLREPWPLEILGVIASNYTPLCIGDIFKFCLLSKSALLVSYLCLPQWIDLLCRYADKEYRRSGGNEYMKMKKEVEILMSFHHHGSLSKLRVVWEKQKERPLGPTKEFLNGCFDLMKMALIHRRMLTTSKVYHEDNISASTKLGELFYYDKEKECVIPFKRIEGLRIADLPRPSDMMTELDKIICENTLPFILEMALVGLDKLKPPMVRAAYYHLSSNTGKVIKTHKPHKKSLVYNAIINDKHIFSSDKITIDIRKNLYSCLSVEERKIPREELIFLFATEETRYKKICAVLGI